MAGSTAIGSEVFKAQLVDSDGVVRGYRGIRDMSLCGESLGPVQLAEGPLLSTKTMSLRCLSTGVEVFRGGRNQFQTDAEEFPGAEVRTLINQGPVQNRIDLTIVGDGYTEEQKEKFFEDAQKIADDLFGQDTFATYLGLFNVHAVFVPSETSGIGDGSPKNTALGLYRHATTRQAVLCGKETTARRAAGLAPDVDYPILLGNDAYYGGLGGEFAITTSAPLNITTVLRHELGHNFGRVGEEYDGGQVYEGANFDPTPNDISWKHHIEGGRAQIYKMDLLHYSAPWKDITKADLEQSFNLSAESRVLIDFSSLGFDTKEDVQVYVDNNLTPFDGKFNYDRNFYLIEVKLAKGSHKLRFHRAASDSNNIISKIAIYMVPENFPIGTMQVGAFATYNYTGTMVGYRPTDRVCLMKDMQSHHFCSVCMENMWSNFLKEVNLVDAITVDKREVKLSVIPVGISRLQIRWYDANGKLREGLNDKLEWTASASDLGNWKVMVRFVSSEIIDPNQDRYTVHRKEFRIN